MRKTGKQCCRVQNAPGRPQPGLLIANKVDGWGGGWPLIYLKWIAHKSTDRKGLAKKMKKGKNKIKISSAAEWIKWLVQLLHTGLTISHFLFTAISVIHNVIAAFMPLCRLNHPPRTRCLTGFHRGLFGPIMSINDRQVAAESHSVALRLHMLLTVRGLGCSCTRTQPLCSVHCFIKHDKLLTINTSHPSLKLT